MKPFTYYLYHIPTGNKYYGVKYSKNCKPTDLWSTYFSSSKKVKSLIEQYGKNSFKYEIRKTFTSKEAAILWEKKVLRRLKVLQKKEWLNSNVSGAISYHIHPRGMKDKKHSDYTKNKLRVLRKGLSYEEIYGLEKANMERAKRSEAHKGKTKEYLKGKTYEQIHGKEKAKELRNMKSQKRGKVMSFTKPIKQICHHCNKLYDPGNLVRHLNRIATQAETS